MIKKSLAVGIILLFLISSITPMVFGYNEESSCSSDEEINNENNIESNNEIQDINNNVETTETIYEENKIISSDDF